MNSSPFEVFKSWLEEAKKTEPNYPEAFSLSTTSKDGQPSSRTLLLKGVTDTHYTFFTNYDSKKGLEIKANSKASMLFYWRSTKKQIHIAGTCKFSSPEVSDNYWNSRPYESRLHAFASKQSKVLKEIEKSKINSILKNLKAKYPIDIPRPENWGGFDLTPTYFEFWEEGHFRWHKRLAYTLGDSGTDSGTLRQWYS